MKIGGQGVRVGGHRVRVRLGGYRVKVCGERSGVDEYLESGGWVLDIGG